MANNDVNKQILKRLDVLVMLTVENSMNQEPLPMSRKILRLLDLGLTQPEVAGIIGKPTKYVTATVAKEKKRKQQKSKKANKAG